MNAELSLFRRSWWAVSKPSWLSREFGFRAALVVLFVTFAELMEWKWLRFVTSEIILRASAFLGMTTMRISFDVIRIQQEFFRFVVPCTFADVFMGSIPLLWELRKPLIGNLLRLGGAAAALFAFNLVRLEIGHVLYFFGVPWMVADSLLGGVAYFMVWLVIWRQRTWNSPAPAAR